jgi:hypothetical protein
VDCPPGTVVVGGGGTVSGDDPEGVALMKAIPKKELDGFRVEYTRVLPVEVPDFGTQIRAFVICASTSSSE